jgi:hydrogenase maturation factor
VTQPAEARCRIGDEHCITCSDEGIAMRVLEVRDDLALCADEQGEREAVAVDLVAPVGPGDRLLVHAGVALTRLEEAA